MQLVSKTFRIFVSSTFSDLKEERNALQREVFPKLRELCMQNGYRFQAIDLRWGVREESALDQQTMNICLDEIARCQRPPRPNFIVLLGNRYGWEPVSSEIPANEFEKIEKQVSNVKDKALLSKWYKLDENAVPPVYCLQPSEVKVKANATEKEKETARDKERTQWEDTEQSLHEILRNAIENTSLTEEQKLKYISSATEQEIAVGALRVPDAEEHVFGFFREIEGLPQDESAEDYIDLIVKGKEKKPDTDAQRKLDELKEGLRKKLGNENIFRYKVEWKGNGITTDHIKKLCDDVKASLSKIIEKEISLIEDKPPLETEIDAHEDFGKDRARVFVGRVEMLKNIQDYISKADKRSLAVYGESGTGKSVLMAYSIQQTKEKHPDTQVLSRFIGATPESSLGRALLESLCHQISRVYGADESDIPTDYKELVKEFPKRLALVTEEKPLVLYLDALDQLSDANDARNLIWLPAELPENVRLIVSTLPGECYKTLKRKISEENLRELQPMPAHEGEKLLDLWLNDAKRALQTHQRKELLGKFRENGLPLYLKLVFEEARRWKSYTEKIKLSPDIRGIIHDLFKRLSSDENHGEMMVSRSLGYLAAAKNGLTEDELIDILSEDRQVFNDFKRRAYHKPPEQRLPVQIWSRLYFDLEPYLTERSADGTSLMSLYHRQFSEAIVEEYLSGEDKKNRHQGIAEYFGKQSVYIERDDKKTPNLRKLSELPFQQTYSNIWKELNDTLTDTEFLEQKNTHFTVYDLLDDYRCAMGEMPGEDEIDEQRSVIQAYGKALDQESFVLKENPELTFQQIYNRLQWQSNKNILLENKLEFEKNHFKRPWLHLITNSAESSALLRTFTGHTGKISSCAFSPDGTSIVSASYDRTLRIWDTASGAERAVLSGHSSALHGYVMNSDGALLLSSSCDCLKLWDIITGLELLTLTGPKYTGSGDPIGLYPDRTVALSGAFALSPDGSFVVSGVGDGTLIVCETATGTMRTLTHTHPIGHIYISPDAAYIVSVADNVKSPRGTAWGRTLKIWDAATGAERATLSCVGYLFGVSPDGAFILLPTKDSILKIWDLSSGVERAILTGHTGRITTLSISPDSSYIVSGSEDGIVKVWDATTGAERFTLIGHTGEVVGCAISPDGTYIVSAGQDFTLRVWDVATGVGRVVLNPYTGVVTTLPLGGDIFARISFAISPNSAFIVSVVEAEHTVSSSRGHLLRLWDATTGAERSTLAGHSGQVTDFAISPDSSYIVSASSDKTLKIWDTAYDPQRDSRLIHTARIKRLAVSPDGSYLVTASADKTLNILEIPSGAVRATLIPQTGDLRQLIISPDCRFIVFAEKPEYAPLRNLEVWNAVEGGEQTTLAHDFEVDDFAISPDNTRIISRGSNNTLKLWDAKSGEEIATHVSRGTAFFSADCASRGAAVFSPDGRRILSTSSETLMLYDAASGEEIARLRGHKALVITCAFSPDGRYILSASLDETVKVWNVKSGREIASVPLNKPEGKVSFTISPDASFVILSHSYAGTEIHSVWETKTGKERATLRGREKYYPDRSPYGFWRGPEKALAISPDAAFVVYASGEKTLAVWNASGKPGASLNAHTDELTSFAISPDSRYVVSIGTDNLLRICSAETMDEVAILPLRGPSCMALHPHLPLLACGDEGGNVHLLRIAGIEHGPVVVTAFDAGEGAVIRCPACLEHLPIVRSWLGNEIRCPRIGCQGRMWVSPFILNRRK